MGGTQMGFTNTQIQAQLRMHLLMQLADQYKITEGPVR